MGIQKEREFLLKNPLGGYQDIKEVVKNIIEENYSNSQIPNDFISDYVKNNMASFKSNIIYSTLFVIKKLANIQNNNITREEIIKSIEDHVKNNYFEYFFTVMENEYKKIGGYSSENSIKMVDKININDNKDNYVFSMNPQYMSCIEEFLLSKNIDFKIYGGYEEFLCNENDYIKQLGIEKEMLQSNLFRDKLILKLKMFIDRDTFLNSEEYRELNDIAYISVNKNDKVELLDYLSGTLIIHSAEFKELQGARLQLVHQYVPQLLKAVIRDKGKISGMRKKVFKYMWANDITDIVEEIAREKIGCKIEQNK